MFMEVGHSYDNAALSLLQYILHITCKNWKLYVREGSGTYEKEVIRTRRKWNVPEGSGTYEKETVRTRKK